MGCVDTGGAEAASSVVILDLAEAGAGAGVRRVVRAGGGVSCLHLTGERLLAGGEGWVAAWRVLDRGNYSRQVCGQVIEVMIH